MKSVPLLDGAGRRRSLASLSSFHQGRPPRNKGLRYPPDPPTVEEIIAVMHAAEDAPDGARLRAVIVVLWRAGLRISEALALRESDLDRERGAVLVRAGKGGKRREVGMDRWAWASGAVARASPSAAGRRVVLRAARTDAWSAVRTARDPCPAPRRCAIGRGSSSVRAPPTEACACRRDVT